MDTRCSVDQIVFHGFERGFAVFLLLEVGRGKGFGFDELEVWQSDVRVEDGSFQFAHTLFTLWRDIKVVSNKALIDHMLEGDVVSFVHGFDGSVHLGDNVHDERWLAIAVA